MLRVDICDSANSLTLKLEGRFTGNNARSSYTLIARCHEGTTLVVDLTEVTFIDFVGEEALLFFGRFGAEFVAQTSYTLDICERLDLRLALDKASDGNTSGASRTKAGRHKSNQNS
jgi:hypothetical protein